jgi:hypothetical protein
METLFSIGTTKSYEIASLLAAISKGEGSSTSPSRSKKEEGQGGSAPLGPTAAGAPYAATGDVMPFTAASASASFGRAATSPPWGGTSTTLHHPYCNLLENMFVP